MEQPIHRSQLGIEGCGWRGRAGHLDSQFFAALTPKGKYIGLVNNLRVCLYPCYIEYHFFISLPTLSSKPQFSEQVRAEQYLKACLLGSEPQCKPTKLITSLLRNNLFRSQQEQKFLKTANENNLTSKIEALILYMHLKSPLWIHPTHWIKQLYHAHSLTSLCSHMRRSLWNWGSSISLRVKLKRTLIHSFKWPKSEERFSECFETAN